MTMPGDLKKILKQMDGNKEMLAEIIEIFLEDSQHDIAALQKAIIQKDTQAIAFPAHGLKGEFGNLGAEKAYQLARNLETAGKEGRLDDASILLQELIHEIELLKSFFNRPDWRQML